MAAAGYELNDKVMPTGHEHGHDGFSSQPIREIDWGNVVTTFTCVIRKAGTEPAYLPDNT